MISSLEESETYKICLNDQLAKIIINQHWLKVVTIIITLNMKAKEIKY